MIKKAGGLVLTVGFIILAAFNSFAYWSYDYYADAYSWTDPDTGENPAYKNQWAWLDGNEDGIFTRHYFDGAGYRKESCNAPGGGRLDSHGRWIKNGKIQTQGALKPELPAIDSNGRTIYSELDGEWIDSKFVVNGQPVTECFIRGKDDSATYEYAYYDGEVYFTLTFPVSEGLRYAEQRVSEYLPATRKLIDFNNDYKARLAEFVSGIRQDLSDFEKEKYVIRWIIDNVSYDYEMEGLIKRGGKINELHGSDSSEGAIVKGRAICSGYAEAFKVLCDKCGLECIVVNGKGPDNTEDNAHAWNQVCLKDENGEAEWYNVDLTWTDTEKRSYINLADSEFNSTHFADDIAKTHQCAASRYRINNVAEIY